MSCAYLICGCPLSLAVVFVAVEQFNFDVVSLVSCVVMVKKQVVEMEVRECT